MGLLENAKKIRYNRLYKFNDEFGDKWYTLIRYTKKGILLKPMLVAYTLEEGKVVSSVAGILNRRKSDSSTFSIEMENGQSMDIKTQNLERAVFEVKNYMALTDVFANWIINKDTVVWLLPHNKVLNRKVFNMRYPFLHAFQFDSNDKIIKCTCGVVTGINYTKNKNTKEEEIDFLLKGWVIDRDSCDIESVSLVGNMEVTQDYDIQITSIEKEPNRPYLHHEIISFLGDPEDYFNEQSKGPRINKSILG